MKGLLIWLWLAQGADVGTTAVALNRGCVEANPVMRMSPVAMTSVKMGVTMTITVHFGRKPAPTKGDKLFVGAFAAAGTTAALLNARTMGGCR